MTIKITRQKGDYSIITTIDQLGRFGDKVKVIAGNQYVAANFTSTNICMGGRTMHAELREFAINNAKRAGYIVKEL